MSKTLKTRPLSVRMFDKRDNSVGVKEIHHHAKGFCDIPERAIKAVQEQHETEGYVHNKSCTYYFAYRGVNICGCRMCTGHDFRKQKNRRGRHNEQMELLKVKKTVTSVQNLEPVEADDFDRINDIYVPDRKFISGE